MADLKGLSAFVAELRSTRTHLVNELRHVDAALSVLGKMSGGTSYTKPRRTLSASARKRISLAQKARWAGARKKAQPAAGSAPGRRRMSAAGRKRIAAAQRARWAKLRAVKK
jgi:hypothetical protein